MTSYQSSRLPLFFLATLIVGVFSGFGGMFLAMLLHFLQHLVYEHTMFPIIGNQTFLFVSTMATPTMRVLILIGCGCIAGFGWWAVFRYGQPLVSITNALKSSKPYMPIKSTLAHVLLQIVTVALGSPLGREVAPRELGAMIACWLTNKMQLHAKERQILVACAAGAGFAAVYNVPFGGALFTLEVLLGSFRIFAVIPALITASIAVIISWMGLGNQSIYVIPTLQLDVSVVVWAVLSGPLFGVTAYWFKQMTNSAQSHAPHNWKIIITCLLNFFMIGCISMYFPAILGNGRSAAQLGFDGNMLGLGVAFVLLLLRFVIVFTSIRAGAAGGLLTPSLANGSLMAIVLGILWSYVWPGISLSAFAVIGAAAFLAAAQKMPITAIVLIIEFTGINFSFFIPILLAVAGSVSAFHYCTQRRLARILC